MFRFAHPMYLWLLCSIILFIAIYIIGQNRRRKQMQGFSETPLMFRLIPTYSPNRILIKFILSIFAIALLIICLASPQIGSKMEKAKRQGADIMIALDISNSMMAEDLKPNRLERARQAISKLTDQLNEDRIGLVVFAGKAYTQLPITTDYAAAKLFLNTVNPGLISIQGTAIGKAIENCSAAFDKKGKKNKAIIIISDGENHEDDAISIARQAAAEGITIHCVGIGSPNGAPVPNYINGFKIGFKKDQNGNAVMSRLNEPMLKDIASAGKGIYVHSGNIQSGLDRIKNEIDQLEDIEYESNIISDYEDRYQYILGLAILILLIETLLIEHKSKWIQKLNIFGTQPTKNIK